jgi:lysophospholipase L1-like esterase
MHALQRLATWLVAMAIVLMAGCGSGSSAVQPTASPAAWRLVTIGDSIPYGQADCGGCDTFTTIFGKWIASGTGKSGVTLNLSTHDNLTGARLLDRTQTNETFRGVVASASVIVVSIGHNDTPWNSADDPCDGDNGDTFNWSKYKGDCVTQLARRHGQELDKVLTEIEKLRQGKPTAVRVTTDYNDVIGDPHTTPDSTVPSIDVLEAFHSESCRVADQHHDVCVDVYRSFNGPDGHVAAGDLLAGDHTHPSAKGHARIAQLLTEAGLRPLS